MEILKEVILKNGSKLVLRKPTEEDAAAMIEYLNIVGGESDNLLFGAGEFRLNEEQEREHIKRVNSSPNTLMIIGLIDNKIISVSQIDSPMRKRIAHNADLSISVKKEYWGMGIGSQVMAALIDYAAKNEVIKNISLGVKGRNTKAKALYEKFGFKVIGVHKNFFNINGKFDDEILMDLSLM